MNHLLDVIWESSTAIDGEWIIEDSEDNDTEDVLLGGEGRYFKIGWALMYHDELVVEWK